MEEVSLYTRVVFSFPRSCIFFVTCHQSLRPKRRTSSRKKENRRDLPTDENHWPVLHVFQLADARVLGLFTLDGGADQVE